MDPTRREPAESPPFRRGDAIDRFTVLEPLGMGGMGVVVSAYDVTLDRKVAIKVLRPDRLTDPEEGRARLLREAQAMARLNHPNVITVHEVGTIGDQVFVAMELVEGETLGGWLGGDRPWREIVHTFARAGRGLAAAHRAGLVHRDFKPDNVLVGADGRVRVTDFGLASVSAGTPAATSAGLLAAPLTRTGSVMGTPAYMSPEQHRGDEADARSDQFSFCVALHEALYRIRPFAGESVAEVYAAISTRRLSAPQRDAPGWLRPLVLRGLELSPDDRWPSMEALLAALESVPRRRQRLFVVAAAAAGAAMIAALLLAQSPVDRCASAAADVDAVWSPAARSALRSAFAATGRPLASDTAARVERSFDAWSGRWRDLRRDTCRRVATGELATSAAARRVDCFERLLDQLRARVALFTASPTADVVDRAVELAALAEGGECADLGEGIPLPSDPARRAAIQAAFRRADELDNERRRVAGRGLAGRADQLIAEAERLDWPPVVTFSRAVAAEIAYAAGDYRRALELASQVAETAPAEEQIWLAASMWEVRLSCFERLDDTAGMDHALLASRALVRQVFSEPRIAVKLQVAIGSAEAARGRLDAGAEACRAAMAAADRLPPDSAVRASPHGCLASIYSGQGKNAEALAEAEASLAARERAMGPKHSDVALDLEAVAAGYQRLGRYREAVGAKRRALAIQEEFWGPDSLRTAQALQTLGWALTHVGEMDEAHRDAMRALAITERAPPSSGDRVLYYLLAAETSPRDPRERDRLYGRAGEMCGGAGPAYTWECVGVYDAHAEFLRERGELTRALPLYGKAIDLFQTIEGVDPSASFPLLTGRGQCLSQLGRHRAALADLEKALAILPADAPRDQAGRVEYTMARVLMAAGQKGARTARLLRAARAHLVEGGTGVDKELGEVDQALRSIGR